jgi:type II secretory pathway pseudopilin PulG
MKKNGFTLAELAIVFLVIGLIIGSVLSGQALIRVARANSVVNDLKDFTSAISLFKSSYSSNLPGDINKPKVISSLLTNGGDGDGKIVIGCNATTDPLIDRINCDSSGANESLVFWNHLGNAGFINLIPMPDFINSSDYAIGVNIPASKIPFVGYSVAYLEAHTSGGLDFTTATFFFDKENNIVVGSIATAAIPSLVNIAATTVQSGKFITNGYGIDESLVGSITSKVDNSGSVMIKSKVDSTSKKGVLGFKI